MLLALARQPTPFLLAWSAACLVALATSSVMSMASPLPAASFSGWTRLTSLPPLLWGHPNGYTSVRHQRELSTWQQARPWHRWAGNRISSVFSKLRLCLDSAPISSTFSSSPTVAEVAATAGAVSLLSFPARPPAAARQCERQRLRPSLRPHER